MSGTEVKDQVLELRMLLLLWPLRNNQGFGSSVLGTGGRDQCVPSIIPQCVRVCVCV